MFIPQTSAETGGSGEKGAEKTSEYNSLRTQLSNAQEESRDYPDEFLTQYERENPSEYADLKDLLDESATRMESSEGLDDALKKVNQAIDLFLFDKEMKAQYWGEGVTVRTEIRSGQKIVKLENPKVGPAATLELTQIGEERYYMADSNFQYDNLEDVSEDVALFQTALKMAVDGKVSKDIEKPFLLGDWDLHLVVVGPDLEKHTVGSEFGFDFIDAKYPEKYVEFVNKRYRQLMGMEEAAPVVAAAVNTSSAEPAVEEVEEEYDLARSLELGNEIEKQYDLIFDEWEANYVAPAPSPEPEPETVPAADAALASASTAPRATVSSAPSTVEAAEETTKKIASEAEFAATLSGEGWKKYVDLSGTTEGGSITIKGLDKGTPEYKYSRIHHFFGPQGAAMKLTGLDNYNLTVSGKKAEWKSTSQYPSGTLVEAGTDNRLWVENGTRIEWKKKEAPLVASAPREAAPVPVPAPTPAPEVAAPVETPPDAKSIRELWVAFDNAQSALKIQEIQANKALFGKKAKLKAVAVEKAKLRGDYLALQPRLEKLKSVSPEVTPETAFLADALPETDNSDLAKWLGVETVVASAGPTSPEEPAGKTLNYPDGSKFVGTTTEAGVPLKGTYTDAAGNSVKVHLDPANPEAPFDMTVGGGTVAMRWDDGDVPGAGGFIRADMGLPSEPDANPTMAGDLPPTSTIG